jgi:hypothetical protein
MQSTSPCTRLSRVRQALGVLERFVMWRSMCPGLEIETFEDYPLLLRTLQSLLYTYDRDVYRSYPSNTLMSLDGKVFSFWGRPYMITPSTIFLHVGQGLFVAQDIHVPCTQRLH